MEFGKLTVDLKKNLDRNGRPYYFGALKFPGNIDAREGIAFMVFVSEEGNEELQVGALRERKNQEESEEDDND